MECFRDHSHTDWERDMLCRNDMREKLAKNQSVKKNEMNLLHLKIFRKNFVYRIELNDIHFV